MALKQEGAAVKKPLTLGWGHGVLLALELLLWVGGQGRVRQGCLSV